MITATAFAHSATTETQPPSNISPELKALWLAKAGRWNDAHDACQQIPGPTGAWIHAYLHREEGDFDNAAYWYQRAHQPVPPRSLSIADEWRQLVETLQS
ncbi:MAG: hypothetical protein RLZZ224_773 [Verrucomicrobiota bacterium]|jgi:hypothetical protein